MPVHTHSGPAPREDYGPHLGIYVTEVRWWGVRPLWFALWSGVFERFPRLRWGVTECGAFWANDLLWLMDTRFLREHSAKKMSHLMEGDLTMPPSAYFDRNCFIGATTTERRELARRYEIGVANLLWGNDFPHPEGTWPHTRTGCDDHLRTSLSPRPGRCWVCRRPRSTGSTCRAGAAGGPHWPYASRPRPGRRGQRGQVGRRPRRRPSLADRRRPVTRPRAELSPNPFSSTLSRSTTVYQERPQR